MVQVSSNYKSTDACANSITESCANTFALRFVHSFRLWTAWLNEMVWVLRFRLFGCASSVCGRQQILFDSSEWTLCR